MTREEATEYFKMKVSAREAIGNDIGADYEAYKIALSALRPVSRGQVEKVWNGCDLCLDDSWQRNLMIPKRFDHTSMLSAELAQFCPGCGRPLTGKAVQVLMERLEALHEIPPTT